MEKTSWNGTFTKALRAKGIKNFYTRYADRRNKTGLQIVVPHETYLQVYTASGVPIGREPKYHNYNSFEKTAQNTYAKQIRSRFNQINKTRAKMLKMRRR